VVTFQGEGYNSLKVNLGDEDVKRRKDEFFDGAGANYWGGVGATSQFGTGDGGRKIILGMARFPLTLLKKVVYFAA